MFTLSGFNSVRYYIFVIVDKLEILRHRQVNKFFGNVVKYIHSCHVLFLGYPEY
jgi:hypothetical protein